MTIKAAPTKMVLTGYAGFDPKYVDALAPAIPDEADEDTGRQERAQRTFPRVSTSPCVDVREASPTPSTLKVNERLA